MSAGEQLVEIFPPTLTIHVVPKKDIATEIVLRNITDKTVTFKVKTTAPERYQVRPIQGRIEPGATVNCCIVMKALDVLPDFDNSKECKHKFLLQTVEAPAEDVDLAAFWKETEIAQKQSGNRIYFDQRIVCRLRPEEVKAQPAPTPAAASNQLQSIAPGDFDGLLQFSTKQKNELDRLLENKEHLYSEIQKLNEAKTQLETRVQALQKENADLLNSAKKGGSSKLLLFAFLALLTANVGVLVHNYV